MGHGATTGQGATMAGGWLALPGGAVRLAEVNGWRLDHDDAGPVLAVAMAGGPLLWRGSDAAAVCAALWRAFGDGGGSGTGGTGSGGAAASHGRQRAAEDDGDDLGAFLRRVGDVERGGRHG